MMAPTSRFGVGMEAALPRQVVVPGVRDGQATLTGGARPVVRLDVGIEAAMFSALAGMPPVSHHPAGSASSTV